MKKIVVAVFAFQQLIIPFSESNIISHKRTTTIIMSQDMWTIISYYRPLTKMWEGNVFTDVR